MAITSNLRFATLGGPVKLGIGTEQVSALALEVSEYGLISAAWSIPSAVAVRRFYITPDDDDLFTLSDLSFLTPSEQIIRGAAPSSSHIDLANFSDEQLLVYFQSPNSYGTPYGLAQLVDETGNLVGSALQPSNAHSNSSLVEVDGKINFITGYPSSTPSLQVLSATSTGISQQSPLILSSAAPRFNKTSAAALDDGTQLYIWSENNNYYYQSLWLMKADGSTVLKPLGHFLDIASGVYVDGSFEVAPVEGGFALLFHKADGNSYRGDLYLQIFNNDATARTTPIIVSGSPGASQNWNPNHIFEIEGGYIVAVFNNNQYRIFDPNGNALSYIMADEALTGNGSVLASGHGFLSTVGYYNGAYLHARELIREWTGDSEPNFLEGSELRDLMSAGPGNDTVIGGLGNDRLDGGSGDDMLSGGEGDDTLIGGDGNDTLDSGAGKNRLEGLAGNDTYIFDEFFEENTIIETSGYDTIFAYASFVSQNDSIEEIRLMGNVISGSVRSDRAAPISIYGNSLLASSLEGGSGADTLVGAARGDALYGKGGNDILIGGAGGDLLDGGDGFDFAFFGNSTAITVDLNGVGSAGDATADLYVSIEGVIGSEYADQLTGNALGNELIGGSGNDLLQGLGGADFLDGGAGNDYAFYGNASTGVAINLATGTGSGGEAQGDVLVNVESVIGSVFADSLTGSAVGNELLGGAGDDTLEGFGGSDYLDGGAGNDTASYLSSTAAVSVYLTTGAGSGGDAVGDVLVGIENLYGSGGGDVLGGDAGANLLFGAAGTDTLQGGAGDDVLIGGEGGDIPVGGAGTDVFLFRPERAGSGDLVLDFDQAGDDFILFQGFDAGFAATVRTANLNSTDVIVYSSAWDSHVVLKNAIGLVDPSDFLFA
jgi:Ca2+-binding RTX toxin-like protein